MKLPRTDPEIRFAQAQGRILHRRRVEMAMTRKELCTATGPRGLSQQAIFRIETGAQTASAFDLALLGKALDLTYAQMLPDMHIPNLKPGHSIESLWALAERCRPERAYA